MSFCSGTVHAAAEIYGQDHWLPRAVGTHSKHFYAVCEKSACLADGGQLFLRTTTSALHGLDIAKSDWRGL